MQPRIDFSRSVMSAPGSSTFVPCGHDSHHDDRAAFACHAHRLPHGHGKPDRFERVVDSTRGHVGDRGDGVRLGAVHRVGRAELPGEVELPRCGVHGDDAAAPAMRHPWMIDRPTPPQPITATLLPARTRAVFSAAP
jgi:hypothetical protein